jgi:hypothetical protein
MTENTGIKQTNFPQVAALYDLGKFLLRYDHKVTKNYEMRERCGSELGAEPIFTRSQTAQ